MKISPSTDIPAKKRGNVLIDPLHHKSRVFAISANSGISANSASANFANISIKFITLFSTLSSVLASTLLLILLLFGQNPCFALAHHTTYCHRCHSGIHCPYGCYYYGYNFDTTDSDYQIDNACVDFCIDKKHTLRQCTLSCSIHPEESVDAFYRKPCISCKRH